AVKFEGFDEASAAPAPAGAPHVDVICPRPGATPLIGYYGEGLKAAPKGAGAGERPSQVGGDIPNLPSPAKPPGPKATDTLLAQVHRAADSANLSAEFLGDDWA